MAKAVTLAPRTDVRTFAHLPSPYQLSPNGSTNRHRQRGPLTAATTTTAAAGVCIPWNVWQTCRCPGQPSVTGQRWPRSAAGRHHGGLVAVAGFQAGSRTSSSRQVAREPGRREVQVHRPCDLHRRIRRYPSVSRENRLDSEAGPTKSAVAHMSAHIRLGPTTVTDPERSTKVPVA